MAFTKVTNAGIGSTNTVLLHNLNVVGTVTATDGIFSGIGSFGGNVTIGGVLTYEDVTNVDSVGLITARNGISVLGAGVTIASGGLNVNAGVSTFGGNVKVGSGITFSPDGDLYSVGISTFKDIIYIADKILHDGDGNTGIRFPAADTFAVETAGTQRLRIDSVGNIGQAVTPSGWSSAQANDFFAYQIGTGMAIFGRGSGDLDRGGISCNYYNTSSAQKYIGNGHAGRIYFEDGNIVFSNAAENSSGADAAMTLNTRMTIAADGGKVSIGDLSTPDSLLHIHDGSAGSIAASSAAKLTIESSASDYSVIQFLSPASAAQQIRFGDVNDNGIGYIQYNHADNNLSFGANGPERMRILDTGNVLISHSTSHADMYSRLQVCDTSSAGSLDLGRYTANPHPPYLNFFKSRSASIGGNTVIQSDDKLGYITFSGNDGGGFHEAASIYAAVDGTPGDNDMPGRLVFQTVPDGSTTAAERMRIDKDGNLGVNITNPAAYGKFVVKGTGNIVSLNASSGKAALSFFENGTGRFYLKTLDGGDGLQFVDADGSTERMNIGATGVVNIPASTNSSSLSMNPGSNAGSLVFDRNGWITSNIRASDGGSNVGGGSGGGSKMQLNKEYIQFFTFPYTTNVGDAPTYSTRFQVDTNGVTNYGSGNGNGAYHFSNSTANVNRHAEHSFGRTGGINRGTTACVYIGENSNAQGEVIVSTSGSNASMSGGVIMNDGATSWASNSDTRLKNKISDITNALTDINQIDTWKYSWKSDSSNTPKLGVTAQSVQTVYPETVSQRTNKHDESDTTEYLNVAYTELVPVCIAAIKELKAKVETLETEVAALKSS